MMGNSGLTESSCEVKRDFGTLGRLLADGVFESLLSIAHDRVAVETDKSRIGAELLTQFNSEPAPEFYSAIYLDTSNGLGVKESILVSGYMNQRFYEIRDKIERTYAPESQEYQLSNRLCALHFKFNGDKSGCYSISLGDVFDLDGSLRIH